ncbi:ABC transporter substrate-binding protein [Thermosynechococcaceae cyanobacterium BACA0444]|uniref:ABC transporter substrate-binding protein n=1 Tax=Pseudocalidococcus azoricus BACA0444 TaxID=2918990 RepID=A0AAE4JXM7_9CYAN|nr:ABC transporter substrate-binding protein [Pseudocalidococcus azoricus]MDS3860114.1 ABC transporter substrate-binding protein [Pseudocalidococcus azoricus BACA0444]
MFTLKHRITQAGRWLRWLGLGLLCLMLWGCGAAPKSDVIQLTFWQGVNPPPNREVLQKLVDRFNQAHPHIQVESIYVGQPDQQLPKILAAVVGNAPPDLLWYNPTITGQLVELGAIRNLDDWWQTSPLRPELEPALQATMTFENQIWSVPFATNNLAVFYRPSLFKAAGITTLPQTWSEFRQVARQLTQDTNGDGRVDQHGIMLALGQGDFAVFTWLPFLWSAGGGLGTAVNNATLNSPGAAVALQFWADLIQDGSAILSLPERGYELDNFLTAKVAMQITGPWTLGQLQQAKTDFAVMPIPRDVQAATALGGENLFIFKTTPAREKAAWVFAEYVMSQDFQTEFALGTGYLPVNRFVQNRPQYQSFLAEQPALNVFLEQMPQAQARPLFPGYARFSESLGRALESVLLGQESPTVALNQAQARWQLLQPRAPTNAP